MLSTGQHVDFAMTGAKVVIINMTDFLRALTDIEV